MTSRGRKAQLVPFFGTVELVTCLWIACAVVTLVACQQSFYIHGRYGKREEPRVESYIVSSNRYGRSDGSQKSLKPGKLDIVPRVDRFFLGSRYGKRSSPGYRAASSIDRFTAVLDYMDRVAPIDVVREDDAKITDDFEVVF